MEEFGLGSMGLYASLAANQAEATDIEQLKSDAKLAENINHPPCWFRALDTSMQEKIMLALLDEKKESLAAEKVIPQDKVEEISNHFSTHDPISSRLQVVTLGKNAADAKLSMHQGGIVLETKNSGIRAWWKLVRIILRTEEGGESDITEQSIEQYEKKSRGEDPKYSLDLTSSGSILLTFDTMPCPMELVPAIEYLMKQKRHPNCKAQTPAVGGENVSTIRQKDGTIWDGRGKELLKKQTQVKLRFHMGMKVMCNCGSPMMPDWRRGRVIGFWYREPHWPSNHPGFPYQMALEAGPLIFASQDIDHVIRAPKEGDEKADTSVPDFKKHQQKQAEMQKIFQGLFSKLVQGIEPSRAEWKHGKEMIPTLDEERVRTLAMQMKKRNSQPVAVVKE